LVHNKDSGEACFVVHQIKVYIYIYQPNKKGNKGKNCSIKIPLLYRKDIITSASHTLLLELATPQLRGIQDE
jgi:hypothetical protein